MGGIRRNSAEKGESKAAWEARWSMGIPTEPGGLELVAWALAEWEKAGEGG